MVNIRCIHIRRFRSIAAATLPDCGPLNVLIGKNNAGKSNVFGTIDLLLSHLAEAAVANSWRVTRPADEFKDRDTRVPIQVGIEFDLSRELNAELRERLVREVPHLENAISQVATCATVSFVLCGAWNAGDPFLFIEQLCVGSINASRNFLEAEGIKLLGVSEPVARELYGTLRQTATLNRDIRALETIAADRERIEMLLRERREGPRGLPSSFLLRRFGVDSSPTVQSHIENAFSSAGNVAEFEAAVRDLANQLRAQVLSIEKKETTGTLTTFAGEARIAPEYATWLMQQYGRLKMLHLKENKQPIGPEEAGELLRLKIRRGGPQRFASVQQTVQALLGVTVDAFQAEEVRGRSSTAEMDVDEFLAEANGAGVREALRLVLDLELKSPQLVLIEEPEVHLHPGLEHAVHAYLRAKSSAAQIFVTTHSTNFVDSASFQNIYLVSRSAESGTTCASVDAENSAFRIPGELGLRLSTVFMFDRLVFVEGPSDEAVLREFATTLGMDLAKANVGFVHMGGVRNFAHFAAEGTLDLLSKRQVRMWFVVDRDERDDEDVQRMVNRLGTRAELTVLKRREIENYLVDEAAVHTFLERRVRGTGAQPPTVDQVRQALRAAADGLKDEVLRLRLQKHLLSPVFLEMRNLPSDLESRLDWGIQQLQSRRDGLNQVRDRIANEINTVWSGQASDLAPGSLILERAVAQFSARFDKSEGDSARIAHCVRQDRIPSDLRELLTGITGT
jgi:putative ATP-dependent endonuclease of the OLD family